MQNATSASSTDVGNAPGLAGFEQANRRYREGVEKYAQALQDAQTNVLRPWHEAQEKYLKSMQTLREEIKNRAQELSANTGKAAADAMTKADAQTRYVELQHQYVAALRELYEASQKQAAEAIGELGKALEQAHRDHANASRDAFRDYVRSLQDAWSQIDVNALAREA